MKKITLLLLSVLVCSNVWAAPSLTIKAFKQGHVLATIRVTKSMNAFYKTDLYFTLQDNEHEFSSHGESKAIYHPFFANSYIVNEPTSTPINSIVKAEAKLIIQSCTSKECDSCSIVKEEYLNLDIVDNDIKAITPNIIDVVI